jgi:hypothetical protein
MADTSEEIVRILAPVIGEGLATSALSMQCRKMGIMPENLHGPMLIEFAERIRVPIRFFAGESSADQIVRQIKALE